MFFFTAAPEKGWYFIKSLNGNGCIDVPGGKNANGVQMIIYNCNNQSNQKFRLFYMGNFKWKIYTSNNKALCTPRSFNNGSALNTWDDHEGDWMEWYLVDLKGYKISPEEKKQVKVKINISLEKSIGYKNPGTQYFNDVGADQFNEENAGKILQAYLVDMKATDQWNAVLSLIDSIKVNQDAAARSSMYKAISEVKIKPADGALEGILRNAVKDKIAATIKKEKDASAKQSLTAVKNQF